MSRRILQPRRQVCQLCDFITTKQSSIRLPFGASKSTTSSRQFCTSRRLYLQSTPIWNAKSVATSKKAVAEATSKNEPSQHSFATGEELAGALRKAQAACNYVLNLDRAPTEIETLRALWQCEFLAKLIRDYESPDPKNDGAVSALLQLDKTNSRSVPVPKAPPTLQGMVDTLSGLAYSVIKHPPVFIAPKVLELYVSTQTSLRRPQSLPEAFYLYANKPLPKNGTSPIRYTSQNPNIVGNAIPAPVADQALQSAISGKQLTTAMDLIENSYATKSFQRAKFVRKGLLPVTGLALAPVAAYTVASQLAILQTTMDTQMATNVAFTGLLAYIGFTATIGIVAITTANDQMDRVTWSQGMPLRERWIREEERAAIDRVAQSWGFKETWRRGEEEGVDWEALREWTIQRGMILDAAELMEGME